MLATGGTAAAALALLEELQLKAAGLAFILEIAFLGGRAKLGSTLPIHTVLSYDAAGEATIRE